MTWGHEEYRNRNIESAERAMPLPVWVAALIASHCQATAGGCDHDIRWKSEGGRLLYTNTGTSAEVIEPLGVTLESGHTVAVSWVPKETSYTIEVFRQFDCCA